MIDKLLLLITVLLTSIYSLKAQDTIFCEGKPLEVIVEAEIPNYIYAWNSINFPEPMKIDSSELMGVHLPQGLSYTCLSNCGRTYFESGILKFSLLIKGTPTEPHSFITPFFRTYSEFGVVDSVNVSISFEIIESKNSQCTITNITEYNKNEDIHIYPNPSNDYSIINIAIEEREDIQVFIYNQFGNIIETIFKGSISSSISLQTPKLSKGIYFIKINISDEFYIKKLIVN